MRTLAVPTRLNWIALLLTVGATLSLFACSSMATTWLMPQRALSPQEWLAYDLSGADVAGVATLVAVRDTVVDIAADGSGLPARVLVLSVSQWLKGAHPGNRIEIGVSPLDESPLRTGEILDLVGQPHSMLFLAHSLENGYVLCDGPDPSGVGLRSTAGAAGAALVAEVRRLVAHDRPDALLARSDAVVVGEFIGLVPCGSSTAPEQCARVRVVERLRGDAVPDTLAVSVTHPADVPEGPALYVLGRRPDAVFEPLGYQAGTQRLSEGIALRWHLSLPQLRSAIARLQAKGRASP